MTSINISKILDDTSFFHLLLLYYIIKAPYVNKTDIYWDSINQAFVGLYK